MSDTATIETPLFPEGILCLDGLTETQAALVDRMVYAIIRPALNVGLDNAFSNAENVKRFVKHVVDKVNEYAEFVRILGGHHYYNQLMLENVIAALRDHHDAPKSVLVALEACV